MSLGRAAFRASLARTDLVVVAINHTAPSIEHLLHAIKFDTTHGRLYSELRISDDREALVLGDRRIHLFSSRDPAGLDWASAGAEYVIESTGKMTTIDQARVHIDAAGAKRVIISAPSKDAKTCVATGRLLSALQLADLLFVPLCSFVFGVNHAEYRSSPTMDVVSNASCTTNCLAPIAAVLDREFGIESATMTTIHASTASQHILDGFSKKDWRSGRGVQGNIIPTSTGAAKAIKLVLPNLAGKFSGAHARPPTRSQPAQTDVSTPSPSPRHLGPRPGHQRLTRRPDGHAELRRRLGRGPARPLPPALRRRRQPTRP